MEQVKIVADKRTNSVLIVAEPSRMDQVVDLVQKLDGEPEFETSGMYIIPLKHRKAVDMAKLLNQMYRISVSETTGAPTSSGAGGTKPGQPVGPAGGLPSTGGLASTTSQPFGTEPTIVPDADSNSIIVVTDRATYQMLLRTTERLDRRRPQVLIKATVIEVRGTDTYDFGFELARAVDPEGTITTFGRSAMGYSAVVPFGNTVNIVPADTVGLTLALLKDRFGNIGAMLKALKDKGNVSIIDEPEVATLDNGNAEIKLSNTVQIPRTIIDNNATQTSFDSLAAETLLSISPHISEGGYLRLDTRVKIEKFTFTSADPNTPPAKTAREVNTPILVGDGRTVVIGGIVTSDRTDSRTSVPVLGDIPIFGVLFSRTRQVEDRRTLYVFITPHILYDEAGGDWRDLTEERKASLIQNGVHPDSVRHLQLAARGEPIPWSSFRFVRPKEDN
jgi:general secretion pathway protein D